MDAPDQIAYQRYCDYCRKVVGIEPLDFEAWYRRTYSFSDLMKGQVYYGNLKLYSAKQFYC